jgi:transposase
MERKIIERLRAGLKVRAVARELEVGRPRVREVLALAQANGYLGVDAKPLPPWPAELFPTEPWVDGRSLKTSDPDRLLTEHVGWIRERLMANWKPVTVFEELPVKNISRSSFYRFLTRYELLRIADHQTGRDRRITPIVHEPGEALLLDWGKVRDVFDPERGLKRTLWAFVGVLGCSRLMTVRLVWTNDVPTTCAALQSMLAEFGGVPKRLTSDNPKCFALEASRFEPLLNPALERFAAHYSTTLECLPPRDPQKKGKVERLMPFVRRLFEAYDFTNWQGLDHAQNYITQKCVIANERVHGTTRRKPVEDFLTREAPALQPLPPLHYEIEDYAEATVRRDAFVRFQNKYYALPDALIAHKVQILGTHATVSIFAHGKLVESYPRITNASLTHATKDHLKKPWERLHADHGHYLKNAERVGPNLARMVGVILEKDSGFVDTRKIWGLLSLDKTFDPEAIDEAAKLALAIGRTGYRVVRDILQNGPPRTTSCHSLASTPTAPTPKFSVQIADYAQQLTLVH